MVLPMKKVFLVVQDKNHEESLKLLRKIGVLHLERKTVSSAALTELLAKKARADNVLRILKSYDKDDGEERAAPAVNNEIIDRVLELTDERKSLQEELARLKKEQGRILEWGNFEPDDIEFLSRKGNLDVFLYKLPLRALENLPSDINYIVFGGDKNFARILVPGNEIPGRAPFNLGDSSLNEIDSSISHVLDKLANVDGNLRTLAKDRVIVELEIEKLLTEIEFESTRAKLNVLEDVPAESAISWLSGYVPQEDLGLVKRGAQENGWALLAEDPSPDDFVPTKLKHNGFQKMLGPVIGFLNITPGYYEPDISGWFLLFFTIFFGMIFGDAVYGALFILIALIAIFKSGKKGVHPGIKLLLLLGGSNFLWGVLTCSWFGLPADQVPLVLQNLSLPLISNQTAAISPYHEGIVRQNLMIICFSLALVQLSIGHFILIFRTRSLKILGDVGSIAMIVGMYGIVLSLIASNEYRQIPLLMPFVYLLGVGFVLVFVFSGYSGSIGGSILDGFKNIISMILGVANVFSDIMSYIRLWAVGLAGAAIASTVISMAGPLLGNMIFFIMGVIILFFGHGLNIVLNLLSVLVHGVRLNTLEFSGHAGITWSGTAYKPFSEGKKSN